MLNGITRRGGELFLKGFKIGHSYKAEEEAEKLDAEFKKAGSSESLRVHGHKCKYC